MSNISIRDYFAAKAMASMILLAENPHCKSDPEDTEGIERERKEFALSLAKQAYRAADAMIEASGMAMVNLP